MSPQRGPVPASQVWADPAWRQEATRWIDGVLARRGVTRVPTTPRQPRIRPWSTHLVVDTDQGRVWFKAAAAGTAHEVAACSLLADVAPDLVPQVWAVDPGRGWMLLPDQGRRLSDLAPADELVGLWSAVLRRYARLQRASAGVVDALARAGVPRLDPPALVERWLARTPERGAPVADRLRAAAQRLEEVGLPATIEHGDLHPGNVLCTQGSATGVQESTVVDWGDCWVGHPLTGLRVALDGASPAQQERLVRAYLSGWADLVPTARLTTVVPDALLIGRLGRVLAMDRALQEAGDGERRDWTARVTDVENGAALAALAGDQAGPPH